MSRFILGALLMTLTAAMELPGCGKPPGAAPPPQSLPTIELQLGNRSFTLEIADNDKTREVGLMNRDSMPADHGMIFIFPDERPLAFWMRNTRIPLDLAYLDRNGKIVSIHTMQPYDLTSTESARPAKYAIELNQGSAVAAGLRPGDTIQIPPALTNAGR